MISLSSNIKTQIIKELIQSDSVCEYVESNEGYIVKMTPEKNMKISIVDDNVIQSIGPITIIFENENDIDSLMIVIESGKYHDDDKICGFDYVTPPDDIDFDSNTVTLKCNNHINKLIVIQKMHTEHIYSYYGNQDGFDPATIKIDYNSSKYKNINFDGHLTILTNNECNEQTYDLIISI